MAVVTTKRANSRDRRFLARTALNRAPRFSILSFGSEVLTTLDQNCLDLGNSPLETSIVRIHYAVMSAEFVVRYSRRRQTQWSAAGEEVQCFTVFLSENFAQLENVAQLTLGRARADNVLEVAKSSIARERLFYFKAETL